MRIAPYVLISAAIALPLGVVGVSAAPVSIYISGYEYLLGTDCIQGGKAATCGVQFGFWTGGRGQRSDGWVHFPGDGRGLGKANISYIGTAAFGATLPVAGNIELLFSRAPSISGPVRGTVTWPAEGAPSPTCGTDVAMVSLTVQYSTGGSGIFSGCLHDLPKGSVIPPKIWGVLN
jgi:hypothetical protein